nr:unnamed protein product [Callosobruchus chinensis]
MIESICWNRFFGYFRHPYNKFVCHNYLTHQFFRKYDKLRYFNSIRPGKIIAGTLLVSDIKALKYSNDGVLFKFRHSEENWQPFPVRVNMKTSHVSEDNLPKLHKSRLRIKAEKYNHLQILKGSMEIDHHNFYDNNLPHD